MCTNVRFSYGSVWSTSFMLLVLPKSSHNVTLNIALQEQGYVREVLIWLLQSIITMQIL